MNARTARRAVVCSALVAAWPAHAQDQSLDCRAAPPHVYPLLDREAALSSFEEMPQGCLKVLFAGCAEAAGKRLLDLGSASICSIGYEALLKQGFGGDFQALMGWWRGQRGPGAGN